MANDLFGIWKVNIQKMHLGSAKCPPFWSDLTLLKTLALGSRTCVADTVDVHDNGWSCSLNWCGTRWIIGSRVVVSGIPRNEEYQIGGYASIPERKIRALIAPMQNNLSDLYVVSNMHLLNFQWHFMISWHGNAFRITDPLWWESTSGRWFPIRTVQQQQVPYS